MKNINITRAIILMFALFSLSSCSAINSSVGGFFNMDTDLEIRFKVDSDINPDDEKKPSPLFLRMYELTSTKMFKKANFIDIYEKDEEVLGADMISKQILKRIKPGENRVENYVLDKKTRYIGIYAEFLQFKKSGYKLIIPVVPTNVIGTSEDILIAGNKLIHLTAKNDYEEDEKQKNKMKKSIANAKKGAADAKAAAEKAEKLKSLF